VKSRTPRNYAGIQNPAKKMADLLPEVLADLGKKAKVPKEEVSRVWMDLIGEKMAKFTEVASFVDGILTVKVKSSTLYSLLVTHERPRLLAKLQEQFSIRNIVFRVG
jgi:hypothetical protein